MSVTSSPDGIAGEVSHETVQFFWLVDVSGSMAGNKIQTVNWAIKQVVPAIQRIEEDERVKVLIRTITFEDSAKWYGGDDPINASDFKWTDLSARPSNFTVTAQAVELLLTALDVKKIGMRNAPPVCILLSDGWCTDPIEQYNEAIKKLDSHPWGAKAARLSIGIGDRGIGDQQGYNKEQLDQFISPYLRNERNVETLPADTPRKLVDFIVTAATTAIVKSSSKAGDVEQDIPVDVSVDELFESPALDPENLPDPHKVF